MRPLGSELRQELRQTLRRMKDRFACNAPPFLNVKKRGYNGAWGFQSQLGNLRAELLEALPHHGLVPFYLLPPFSLQVSAS